MDQIRIKNEKCALVIKKFNVLNSLVFVVEEGMSTRFRYDVELPDGVEAEDWLIELVRAGQVKDKNGKTVGTVDGFISFDWCKGSEPKLQLHYYGFSAKQLDEAILKALKPQPEIEVTEEERAIVIEALTYKSNYVPSHQEIDELIRKAKRSK